MPECQRGFSEGSRSEASDDLPFPPITMENIQDMAVKISRRTFNIQSVPYIVLIYPFCKFLPISRHRKGRCCRPLIYTPFGGLQSRGAGEGGAHAQKGDGGRVRVPDCERGCATLPGRKLAQGRGGR